MLNCFVFQYKCFLDILRFVGIKLDPTKPVRVTELAGLKGKHKYKINIDLYVLKLDYFFLIKSYRCYQFVFCFPIF